MKRSSGKRETEAETKSQKEIDIANNAADIQVWRRITCKMLGGPSNKRGKETKISGDRQVVVRSNCSACQKLFTNYTGCTLWREER
jgi:hypothetical protein